MSDEEFQAWFAAHADLMRQLGVFAPNSQAGKIVRLVIAVVRAEQGARDV